MDEIDINETRDFIANARYSAGSWAKSLLSRTDWVILDTETTGLGSDAQVLQVSIMAHDGSDLLDTLVKVSCEIDPKAQAVHGITAEQLVDAPDFCEVWQKIKEVTEGKYLVIYNASFDLRMLRQSAIVSGIDPNKVFFMHYDAMEQYARWVGEWNEYRGDFRWQKLPGGDHSAMGDCRATLDIIRKMAEG